MHVNKFIGKHKMMNVNMEKCTGCGACVQRCPTQCILWEKGEFDFLYPEIDSGQCVNCGLCEKICPIEKEISAPVNQHVYAAVHKDSHVLSESTSGGAFAAIANRIFAMGGIVYGVAMQPDMKVSHIRITCKEQLIALHGSKYVQSNIGTSYLKAEQDLLEGKIVLYSGTPCQIDGLKNFLIEDYENLYTVDVVCHGVGSQNYFDKYMEFARAQYGNIKELQFRSKRFAGWSCSGKIVVEHSDATKTLPYRDFENYYYSYFLSGEIYRKCCYSCKYANTKRVGDFSLGDYWGVEALGLSLNTKYGCSLVFVNNKRATNLIAANLEIDMIETAIDQALCCNDQLKHPSILPVNRKVRLKEYSSLSGKQIQQRYLKTHRKVVMKGFLKTLIPYKLKLFVRKRRKINANR